LKRESEPKPWLRGFGKYLPERIVTNAEMAQLLSVEEAWITQMSGIATRRFAAPGETVASMAAAAGREALTASGLEASELGLILVASGSAERRFPGPAVTVQQLLAAPQALALDVPMPSAGVLFALVQAALWAPSRGPVLVIGAEKMSPLLFAEPLEPGTAMLFGDGAGACVVDPRGGLARILDWELGTDGTGAEELKLELQGPVRMNGRSVILHAARKVPAAITTLLERQRRPSTDIALYLMHQANANLITKIAQSLGVAPESFFSNISRYGNTSSASLLIAAAEWAGPWRGPIVMAAFGAGFQWGALLLEGEC
jgi:3-oxoacyl-[acyl-carrier-protein] synthase-3